MDTINSIAETLSTMGFILWQGKYWVGFIVAVLLVLAYFAPVLSYSEEPVAVRKDDRP
jgi:hypothetical protein